MKQQKLNSLKDLVSAPIYHPWPVAEKMCIEGKLMRCISWPEHSFLFYRKPYNKPVQGSRNMYKPLTKEYLQDRGIQALHISGHWCKYDTGKVIVGYKVSGSDKLDGWEEYHQ